MLTKRQKEVLDFVESYTTKKGYSPSFEEIRKRLKLASVSTIHFHISKLKEGGYLGNIENKARTISVASKEPMVKIPLLGTIAAGEPIEAFQENEFIAVPKNIGKDFGNNIDKRELGEYVEWCKSWINESIRTLKPNGTMFIYGFSEILAYLSIEIPIQKRWLIWHYTKKNVASLNFWKKRN